MKKSVLNMLGVSPLRMECPEGMIYNKNTKKCEKLKEQREKEKEKEKRPAKKPLKGGEGNGGTWKDKCGEGFYKNSKGECVPL